MASSKKGKMDPDDMKDLKKLGPKGFAKEERAEAKEALKGAKKPKGKK